MPLPWKKPKSGRISRFVSDLQQSPKHGGSLVVETGFPTSLIDLFVKNRDRLKKSRSSKRNNNAPTQTAPTRPRVLSPPLPQKLDPASVTDDLAVSKINEGLVGERSGLTSENRHDGDKNNNDGVKGGDRGGECCVLMVVAVKVFLVAVLALSTKKLAVGITISAFTLLFIELAVARVFTLLKLCPDVEVRLHSLIGKLIRKKKQREEKVEESSSLVQERKNKNVSFEIIESFQDSRDCIEEVQAFQEEREVETVLTKEKSKSAKLRSKIVKKLGSYKKKKKLKMKEKQEAQGVEVAEEDDETVREVSSLYLENRMESEISERDETGSNPPWLESCEEVEEEESESKGDLTKVIFLVLIALTGLLSGKVIAIVLTVSSCLILRFADKSQTSL